MDGELPGQDDLVHQLQLLPLADRSHVTVLVADRVDDPFRSLVERFIAPDHENEAGAAPGDRCIEEAGALRPGELLVPDVGLRTAGAGVDHDLPLGQGVQQPVFSLHHAFDCGRAGEGEEEDLRLTGDFRRSTRGSGSPTYSVLDALRITIQDRERVALLGQKAGEVLTDVADSDQSDAFHTASCCPFCGSDTGNDPDAGADRCHHTPGTRR